MSVYLACVGAVSNPTLAVASIERIWRRPGDSLPIYKSWTTGTVARQLQVDAFLESEHDHIFMLDADMEYPANCLERLREHKLPVVSGLYMRRSAAEIMPAAWEEPPTVDEFPIVPMLDYAKDALIPTAAVGHGFVLARRDVVEAIRDFYAPWPMMVRTPMPEWTGRPEFLVGPDVRFFYAARKSGYRVWLDTGCRAEHYVVVPVAPEHYEQTRGNITTPWKSQVALLRINRRWTMAGEQKVTKEDLELLLREVNEQHGKQREKRKALQTEAMAYAQEKQRELGALDSLLQQLHGQRVILQDLLEHMTREVDLVRKGADKEKDPCPES